MSDTGTTAYLSYEVVRSMASVFYSRGYKVMETKRSLTVISDIHGEVMRAERARLNSHSWTVWLSDHGKALV